MAQISHAHGTQGSAHQHLGLFCICTAGGFRDSPPYLFTGVPVARCRGESRSIALTLGASAASALSPASPRLEPDGLSSVW